jgi:hypothetical protein
MYIPMAIEYTHLFPFQGPQKFFPIWDIWFENIPSGNPVGDCVPGFILVAGVDFMNQF